MKEIEIAGRKIGSGHPVFIVAEAGVNHNGNVEMAKQLIDAAFQAGTDAVKFQTFKAEKLVSPKAPKAPYQLQTSRDNESQLDLLKRLELSFEDFKKINAYCKSKNILFLSTPFDEESVDFLDELGVPAFKIASGEITNWPFLEYVAQKKKPIILSTGMSYLSEVDEAVRVIRGVGCDQLILLHCVSNYPADPSNVNLRAMRTMANAFQLPIGFSDHTPGIEIAIAAVALGACAIEKHLTLDKTLPGPDHKASLEPEEFKTLVLSLHKAEKSLGQERKGPVSNEQEMRTWGRRSLAASKTIEQGLTITHEMLTTLRPGNGISPTLASTVVGKRARVRINEGSLLRLDELE